jgi:hypothetical protein
MRIRALKALILRDLVIPLLCAALVLGGIASARALGSKAVGTAHLELCLPSGSDDATTHHDCDACCLPMPTSLGRLPEPSAVEATAGQPLQPASYPGQPFRPYPLLPWSRGPPAFG